MYSPANQENPPICARPSCNNTTSKYTRPKNGNIWKKYCCASCQVPVLKGTSKYSYSETAPKCLNPHCQNLTNQRTRKHTGWNIFCSTSCQNIFQGPVILSNSSKDKISITVSTLWDNRTTEERNLIFQKSKKNSYLNKEYILPSGRIIQLRGHEPKAMDELLKIYNEKDILTQNDLMPIISYIKPNGRKAKYFPDIYIPTDNLIIEVKSLWTYSGTPEHLTINLLKEQATIAAGYKFKFNIY